MLMISFITEMDLIMVVTSQITLNVKKMSNQNLNRSFNVYVSVSDNYRKVSRVESGRVNGSFNFSVYKKVSEGQAPVRHLNEMIQEQLELDTNTEADDSKTEIRIHTGRFILKK